MSVDDIVAAVFDLLREKSLLDNTYVIYSADHGYDLGTFRLPSGKFQAFENDIRVPFFAAGATVQAFDPEGMHEASKLLEGVQFRDGPYEAVTGADVVVILTEWDQFRALDLDRVKLLMLQPVMVAHESSVQRFESLQF
jgi:hypothetical protein